MSTAGLVCEYCCPMTLFTAGTCCDVKLTTKAIKTNVTTIVSESLPEFKSWCRSIEAYKQVT